MDAQSPFTDPADIKAENEMLRLSGQMWRNRAEAHAAATVAILRLVHTERNHALQLKKERDALELQCSALKLKLEQSDDSQFPPTPAFFVGDFPTPVPSPNALTHLDVGHYTL